MFSHFRVGVSSIREGSQKVVCVFLSPHEWLSVAVQRRTKLTGQPHIPLTIKGYKTTTKPYNCTCPEQNIWKIKQVLGTETLTKIQH